MNRRRVLIETSWNVKEDFFPVINSVNGINRNIVECKVSLLEETFLTDSVLIETSWNVKQVGKAIFD